MKSSGETVNEVIIVGGGEVGLFTAFSLSKHLRNIQVKVIDEADAGSPEIGKGTYFWMHELLHDWLDIDVVDFVSQVKPVWKQGVFFKTWGNTGGFMNTFEPPHYDIRAHGRAEAEKQVYTYESGIYPTLGREIIRQRASPVVNVEFNSNGPSSLRKCSNAAYHLPLNRFNAYLRDLCEQHGVRFVDDRITTVEADGQHIESVVGNDGSYTADLYVDSTGFNRILSEAVGTDFREFDLAPDSAVAASVDISTDEIVPATVVNSGQHGWFWQIDTMDSRGLGYVYSSEHVSDDEAIAEFIDEHDRLTAGTDVSQYQFESGYQTNAWEGNCVAVGNSAGFVEPLEAHALTTNCGLAAKLTQLLKNDFQQNHLGARATYNETVERRWRSAYNDISTHYLYTSGGGEFWQDMRDIRKPDVIAEHEKEFRRRGFNITEHIERLYDPPTTSTETMFFLHKLGVECEFYENREFPISESVKGEFRQLERDNREKVNQHLSHAELEELGLYD